MNLCFSVIIQVSLFFFFNDTATTEIYTLSLHDALPISTARPRDYHQAPGRARGAQRHAPARQRHPSDQPGGFMNQLTPYAAFFMRLAVGGVFLHHGLMKYHTGIAGVAGFLHSVGVPFATIGAVILI